MNEISPIQFGQLLERVENLVEAMEGANEQSQADRACTRQLSKSIDGLSARIGVIENSWLMQPKKVGRIAVMTLALVVLMAILGIKETITLLAKAAL